MICLAEEAAEVAQAAAKILRFGIDDRYPMGSAKDRLILELNDLVAVIEELGQCGVLPPTWIRKEFIEMKQEKLRAMMNHSRANGMLEKEHTVKKKKRK